MITMIYGGSGSGKSAYAEDTLCALFPGWEKIYLATMEAVGEEGRRRVEKHRMQRAGKGFVTLECPRNVDRIADKCRGRILLLECLSNLVANEMFFSDDQGNWHAVSWEKVACKVVRDLESLEGVAEQLFLVGNNVFEEGDSYDTQTYDYLRALGAVQETMAKKAENLVEVVVGIPLVLKGQLWAY